MKTLLAAIVLVAFTVEAQPIHYNRYTTNLDPDAVIAREKAEIETWPTGMSNSVAGLHVINRSGYPTNLVTGDRSDYSYEIAMHLDEANRHLEKAVHYGRIAAQLLFVFGVIAIALKIFEIVHRIFEPKNHK